MHGTHNEDELDYVYNRGRRAFREGRPRDDNPFPLTDEIDLKRDEWFRGWDDEKRIQESVHKERL